MSNKASQTDPARQRRQKCTQMRQMRQQCIKIQAKLAKKKQQMGCNINLQNVKEFIKRCGAAARFCFSKQRFSSPHIEARTCYIPSSRALIGSR